MEMLIYAVGEWAVSTWSFDQVLIVVVSVLLPLAVIERLNLAEHAQLWRQNRAEKRRAAQVFPPSQEEAPLPAEALAAVAQDDAWRSYVTESGAVVQELGEPFVPPKDRDLAEQIVRLRIELAQARGVAEALRGDAVARVRGRLHSWRGQVAVLAVPDVEGHQRVLVAVPDADERQSLAVGMAIEVIARFAGGRLVAERFLEAEECSEPMPELPEPVAKAGGVPDWFSNAKNEKRELLKASDGSSSVSDLKVHVVFATKRRGAVLTHLMVEQFKQLAAEAVKEKGLGKLLAANCEADHAHLALWLPVNVAPSDAMGQIKAFTSRHLRKEFPALTEYDASALWQRGGFCGSIGSGGDLSAVMEYIKNQDAPQAAQEAMEDAEALADDSEDLDD